MGNSSALGDAVYTFDVLCMTGIFIANFFFTEMFTDPNYASDFGLCGGVTVVESYNIHVCSAAILLLTGIGSLVYTHFAGKTGNERLEDVILWLSVSNIGHGIGHLGIFKDTADGKYPLDEQEVAEAFRSWNIAYIAEKSLPLALLVLFPIVRALVGRKVAGKWIILQCIACIAGALWLVPFWMGTLVFFLYVVWSVAITNYLYESNKSDALYPTIAVFTAYFPISELAESFYCSSLVKIGSHSFWDSLVCASLIGFHVMNRSQPQKVAKMD